MPKSPAYRQDRQEARQAENTLKANPFEDGTRRWKLFEGYRQHSMNMDARFSELEEAYGSIGTRRELV